jgi:hypothetical protein
MSRRIMYLRSETGHPVGCLAIQMNRHDSVISYQLSVLNPSDRFNRAVARQLALGRLLEEPLKVKLSREATMHDISEAVMRDILAYKDAPSRAIKAARLWIRQNGITTLK